MDLHEDKEKNVMTAQFELPGLTKENVNIDLRDNVLTVSGECAMSSECDERGYSVRERRFGKFARSLPVPQGIKVCPVSLVLVPPPLPLPVRCGSPAEVLVLFVVARVARVRCWR